MDISTRDVSTSDISTKEEKYIDFAKKVSEWVEFIAMEYPQGKFQDQCTLSRIHRTRFYSLDRTRVVEIVHKAFHDVGCDLIHVRLAPIGLVSDPIDHSEYMDYWIIVSGTF